MIGALFETLVVQPIFNLLVLIYAIMPGHNFGLAIIIFTVIVRLLMWPLVKKQLHHTKEMRKLQPEMKRVKQAAKGDKQRESKLLMELYKERQISPFSSIGILIVQLIILLGLFRGLMRLIAEGPQALLTYSYDWINNIGWMRELAQNTALFDSTLFGLVDLSRSALSSGGLYVPALIIVIGSAVAQYFQSKQLMPDDKDARGLKRILKDASSGKQADQAEVNAAIGRSTRVFIPVMIFVFTIGIASALSLYWLVGGVVAYIQQARILKQDEEEIEVMASKAAKPKANAKTPEKEIIEGEVIEKIKTKKTTSKKKKRTSGKRRKR